MIRTIEAIIDEKGVVHLLEPIHLPATYRALVTILEEAPADRDRTGATLRARTR